MLENPGIEKCGTNDLLLQSWAGSQQEAPLVNIKPTFMSVFDRNICYPFFVRVCAHLSIAEIVALTRTCKKFADLYQYLLPIHWDVNRRLHRFVRDPHGFRSQMAKFDALIAGSFVIQFFERTSWEVSDLDIYVEGDERANAFQSYLLNKEEYTEISSTQIPKYEVYDITRVQTFLRLSNHAQIENNEEERTTEPSSTKIQLVVTEGMPAESILKGFCSTMFVNFMSWNRAYSVFPLSTFIQYKGYQLGGPFSRSPSLLNEHSLRGWNMQKLMWLEEKRLNHPIRTYRRIGDGFTWTIPFDTKNVQWSKIPDYVLELACFQMHSRQGKIPVAYQINTTEFVDQTLKYRYLSNWDMLWFLREKVDCSMLIEPREMDPAAKPVVYAGIMDNRERSLLCRIEGSGKSGSRTSRDAEFPDWYREWERQFGSWNVFPEFYEGESLKPVDS